MIELSVIIPTRNRPFLLASVLNGLASQSFDPHRYEVIVVDNATTDELSALVSDFKTTAPYALSYLWVPSPGLHRARHAGLRAAKADLLVFADDDIDPFPTWLSAIYEAFSTHDVALVGGKNLPKWEARPPAWLEEMWEEQRGEGYIPFLSLLDLGDEIKQIDPSLVFGCNFAIRKAILYDASGFHPDGMPDDLIRFRGDGESYVSNFVASKGDHALYHPLASVFHLVTVGRMTIKYFKKRAFNQGISESFTRLRRSDAMFEDPPPSRGLISRFIRFKEIDSFFRWILPWRLYFEASIQNAYCEGFDWHQNLFLTDRGIREWVLRRDYLEE